MRIVSDPWDETIPFPEQKSKNAVGITFKKK